MNLYRVEPTLLVEAWDEADALERTCALLEWLQECPFAEFMLAQGKPFVEIIEDGIPSDSFVVDDDEDVF